MRIVTLVENTACREDLTAEHGLSRWQKHERVNVLYRFRHR